MKFSTFIRRIWWSFYCDFLTQQVLVINWSSWNVWWRIISHILNLLFNSVKVNAWIHLGILYPFWVLELDLQFTCQEAVENNRSPFCLENDIRLLLLILWLWEKVVFMNATVSQRCSLFLQQLSLIKNESVCLNSYGYPRQMYTVQSTVLKQLKYCWFNISNRFCSI